MLNLCGADDVLLIFQSLRFRIKIITQNRKFCKPFDKIAALVTKNLYYVLFLLYFFSYDISKLEIIRKEDKAFYKWVQLTTDVFPYSFSTGPGNENHLNESYDLAV